MSLTNPNKVVTEQRLAEFYAAILPYLGGMPEALANKFAKGDLYSTTEKIVGCWTDGRPIYQKTIDCGVLPNNTTKTVNHNITNLLQFVDIKAFAVHSSKIIAPIPYAKASSTQHTNTWNLELSATSTAVQIVSGDNWNSDGNWNAYVTLKYTKTTDAANSFKYSSETDYSTTEHIIGTWIDGKPLYQKTVSCGAMPNNTTKRVSLGLASTCRIKDIKGYSLKSDNSVTIPLPKLTVDTGPGNPNSISLTILLVSSVWNASFSTGGDYSSYTTSYVTVQYTKS